MYLMKMHAKGTLMLRHWLVAFCLMFILPLHAQDSELDAEAQKYQLGPGDLLQIEVFGEDELSLQVRLANGGLVSYPFLGDLRLVGKTTKQVETLIYDGLVGDYLINPSVRVSVLEYRPFFIDGEVKKPGGYPYQPGLTVSKAIALAQGLTQRASTKKISLISSNDPEQIAKRVELNTVVHPGDVINIKQSFF